MLYPSILKLWQCLFSSSSSGRAMADNSSGLSHSEISFPQFYSRYERGGPFSYMSSSLTFLQVWILLSGNVHEKSLIVAVVKTSSISLLYFTCLWRWMSVKRWPFSCSYASLKLSKVNDWRILTILLPNLLPTEQKFLEVPIPGFIISMHSYSSFKEILTHKNRVLWF